MAKASTVEECITAIAHLNKVCRRPDDRRAALVADRRSKKPGRTARRASQLLKLDPGSGGRRTAMEQIELSLRAPGIDANSKARIEAKRTQLRDARKRRDNFK